MKIAASGFIAPVDHHLRPVMTYSSPSRRMRVAMFVASDEATSGSVMQNDERISAFSSGRSHRSFCAGVPKSASTSMFPVSGAAQLNATGPRRGLQPVSSARGAYCRFVSPAPSAPGRNRFHSPCARASACSSRTIGRVPHSPGVAAN